MFIPQARWTVLLQADKWKKLFVEVKLTSSYKKSIQEACSRLNFKNDFFKQVCSKSRIPGYKGRGKKIREKHHSSQMLDKWKHIKRMTVRQLKLYLKQNSLKVSERKVQLIVRVVAQVYWHWKRGWGHRGRGFKERSTRMKSPVRNRTRAVHKMLQILKKDAQNSSESCLKVAPDS